MFYYCTPLRCMEEPGESTWDASLVSRAGQISISSSTSAHDGDYHPWLSCLQSSTVPPVLLVPCPRGCKASSLTRMHVCFLGTSLLHSEERSSPTRDIHVKWLTRKERYLSVFWLFYLLPSLSLDTILSKGVFMLEMFSGKENLLSTIPCCCCFGKLHSPVPESAGVTWPCLQDLVREAWGQLSISPWGTGSPRVHSPQTF